MKKQGKPWRNWQGQSPDRWRAAYFILWSMRSGTDGLVACPSLRRPGDHLFRVAHGFASPSHGGFALSRM